MLLRMVAAMILSLVFRGQRIALRGQIFQGAYAYLPVKIRG